MPTPPDDSSRFAPRGGALLILILAIGAGMYFLGHRSRAQSPASPQGQGQTAQATLAAVAPPGAATPAATAKNGRRLAPRDTFYLLEYVSAKTPSGVIGFEPGQQVHLVEVRQATQTLVVGDGQTQVEVGPDKLTNDMEIAALVRQKDQANQAKIASYIQSEQKAYEESKHQAALATDKDMAKVNQQERESSTVGGGNNKLDQPPVEVAGGYNPYGYAGSAYYGSPYSYFSSRPATTTTVVH